MVRTPPRAIKAAPPPGTQERETPDKDAKIRRGRAHPPGRRPPRRRARRRYRPT